MFNLKSIATTTLHTIAVQSKHRINYGQYNVMSKKLSTNILQANRQRNIYTLTAPRPQTTYLRPYSNLVRTSLTHSIVMKPNSASVFKFLTKQLYTSKVYFALQSGGKAINMAFKKHPLLCGSIFAGIKGVLADLFAQCVIEDKSLNDVNWYRNSLFGFVGVFYTGFVVYGIYVKLYPKLFVHMCNVHWLKRATIQSTFDQICHNALIYFPFFYAFKASVYEGFTIENCKMAIKTYFNENIKDDMKSSFAVWGPANIITFGFIPSHLKTPWMSLVSFIWIVVLSVMRGEQVSERTDEFDKALE